MELPECDNINADINHDIDNIDNMNISHNNSNDNNDSSNSINTNNNNSNGDSSSNINGNVGINNMNIDNDSNRINITNKKNILEHSSSSSSSSKKQKNVGTNERTFVGTIERTFTNNENNFWAETIDNKEFKSDNENDLNNYNGLNLLNDATIINFDVIKNIDINNDMNHKNMNESSSENSNDNDNINDNENDNLLDSELENAELAYAQSKIITKKKRKNITIFLNPNNLVRNIPMGPVGKEDSFAFDLRCLLKYLEIFGNMRIRHSFEIPWNEFWPQEMWSYKLGNQTRKIRESRIYVDKKEELIKIGFSFKKLLAREGYGWDRIKLSLLQYKNIHGNLLVHRDFIVPINDPLWPPTTWGIRLGSRVHHLRNRGDHADKRDELIEMGFKFRVSKLSKFAIPNTEN